MPPMLCLPPSILDQSFPRDITELNRAGISLGVLQEMVAEGDCYISLTPVLASFVELFEWANVSSYPLLSDIYRLITQWLLQPSKEIRIIKVQGEAIIPHPAPTDSGNGLLVEEWKKEVALLLEMHDDRSPIVFFIGVACALDLSEEQPGKYQQPVPQRYFPLVGKQQLTNLADSEFWDLPNDLHIKSVSAADARKNLPVLGATIAKEAVGSHFKVTFPLAPRSWPLDPNTDPIPERFLNQLPALVNLPIEVIKFTLINGRLPNKLPRL